MNDPTAPGPALAAAIAAHRFGLGEPALAGLGADARGWLLAQIGPADAPSSAGLTDSAAAALLHGRFVRETRRARQAAPPTMVDGAMAEVGGTEQAFVAQFRAIAEADLRARFVTAATTPRPLAERLALFWANHFTVSLAKASTRGLVGAFEREAIRPHIAGRFETLLAAATTHPAMLRYLDNDASAGPDAPRVQQLARRAARAGTPARLRGLNENLAREILELHTLGAAGGGAAYGGWGGYTQADVTAFAAVLTGWRVAVDEPSPGSHFDPAWHQPGPKRVLGHELPEGPEGLTFMFRVLAAHPSTARFVCTKLARHFVADDPPPALVARLVQAWQASDGDLAAVSRALVLAPEAWAPQPAKLKTPEEFVLASARVLRLGDGAFERQADGGTRALGQAVQAAPSPAGWPDRADEWLGPDAVWKRVEWATRVAARVGPRVDARAVAEASLGPWLGTATRQQIERAADGAQALALLLLAPEFQRR